MMRLSQDPPWWVPSPDYVVEPKPTTMDPFSRWCGWAKTYHNGSLLLLMRLSWNLPRWVLPLDDVVEPRLTTIGPFSRSCDRAKTCHDGSSLPLMWSSQGPPQWVPSLVHDGQIIVYYGKLIPILPSMIVESRPAIVDWYRYSRT